MKNCPICGTKMYPDVIPQIRKNMICPIHSYFTEEEENASKEYYNFKYDLHRVDALTGLTLAIQSDKEKIIQIYNEKGYLDSSNLLQKKIKGYLDWIRVAEISTLKIAVVRYSVNKGYKNLDKMCSKNEDIINKHSIQFKKDSEYIPSMNVLKHIRDYVEHPDVKLNEVMPGLMTNLPDIDDPLSFLYEPVTVIISGINKSVSFRRGLSEEEVDDFMSKNVRNRSYTSFGTFLDFLKGEIQEVILDIDKNGFEILE